MSLPKSAIKNPMHRLSLEELGEVCACMIIYNADSLDERFDSLEAFYNRVLGGNTNES